jgi:hypothetical protein
MAKLNIKKNQIRFNSGGPPDLKLSDLSNKPLYTDSINNETTNQTA